MRTLRATYTTWRPHLLLLIVALVLLVTSSATSDERPRLVVYLHTSVRPRALERTLSERMPAVEVVVLGRYRDFRQALARAPEATMALQPVLSEHALPIHVRGLRSGADSEEYVLLSIGKTWSKSQFSSLSVGTVDLLGRGPTAEFVTKLLELERAPALKYAVKTEDLLAMLQFRSVDAVLLSERDAKRLEERSRLDLRMTQLSTRVGLAAVSIRSERASGTIRSAILGLNADSNGMIGVDMWR